ncbi:MAG: TPM domain-containing protein [Bacilli bacterium]|nr:TPM domain-containing protein [Bacilli bacterium]
MNRFKYLILVLCLFITTEVHAYGEVVNNTDETVTSTAKANSSTSTTSTPSTSRSTTSRSTRSTSRSSYSYGESSSVSVGSKSTTIQIKEVEGTSYKLFIDDKKELLTSSEEELLFSDMEKLAPYGNIGFLSISSDAGSETTIATNFYVSNFGETNGVIFMINMQTRQLTIRAFSTQASVDLISSNKVDSILANVYRYASKGDYYTCAKNVFNQCYTVITGESIFEPMKIASNAILAFSISSFILYIYVLSSSSIKKASNKEIMNGINRNVDIKDIMIRPNGTRRVYSPQSSSSSGGGGGHSGGGGGGFHSSGGSHGF